MHFHTNGGTLIHSMLKWKERVAALISTCLLSSSKVSNQKVCAIPDHRTPMSQKLLSDQTGSRSWVTWVCCNMRPFRERRAIGLAKHHHWNISCKPGKWTADKKKVYVTLWIYFQLDIFKVRIPNNRAYTNSYYSWCPTDSSPPQPSLSLSLQKRSY